MSKVFDGNSCIGCESIGSFPVDCEGCGNLIPSREEYDSLKGLAERRADLLLKAEAKNEKLNLILKPLIEIKKPYHQWLRPLEKIYFDELMEITKNNQSKVSVIAGLNRGTIRKKLKQYNLI